MHTEEEAKKRWCPFAENRVVRAPDNIAVFADGNPAARKVNTLCVSSHCMAWRWEQKYILDKYPTPQEDAKNEGTGYCGLAGKP